MRYMIGAILAAAILTGGATAQADTVLYLSTRANNTISGVSFLAGDIVAYDMDNSAASLAFRGADHFRTSGGSVGASEDIDAITVMPDGTFLISTASDARLGKSAQAGGTLHFYAGDVVRYDPVTDTAVMYFDGDREFLTDRWRPGEDENIDAFELLPNGHVLLSTTGSARLGNLNFLNSDLIEYNPDSNSASVYFSHNLFRRYNGTFGNYKDIDGAAIDPLSGNLLLSVTSTSTTYLGNPALPFQRGDIVEYNRQTDTATLFFNQSLFLIHCDNDDVDAFDVVSVGFGQPVVPEPLTLLAVGGALAGIARYTVERGKR
jgi:hypothetical protein